MTIHLSAPSKTFLSGEYAVLCGAPGLVLNTGPRFTFTATEKGAGVVGIPDGSPAALLIHENQALLKNWKLEFRDPHAGRGGFGASSGQLLFVFALVQFLRASVREALSGLDLKVLMETFHRLTGGQASGCDILAQATGQVSLVIPQAMQAAAQPWPYPNLNFAILRTGVKIQTHEHLAQLERDSLESLNGPAGACAESFGRATVEQFIGALRTYAWQLRSMGLQAPTSLQILEKVEAQPWCQLAKGCGALGADTVLVFFAAQDTSVALEYLRGQSWECVATTADLTSGLQMTWNS